MANKAFSDTKLAPVGRFHFLRVGDWVYIFEIGEEFCEPTKDYVVEILETFKDFTAASRVALIWGLVEIHLKLTAFEDLERGKFPKDFGRDSKEPSIRWAVAGATLRRA
jgi:hypothetical protein